MGCDIHATLEYDPYEKKYAKTLSKPYTRHWMAFAHKIDINRHYALFATLADVRNDGSIKPLDAPRGIPNDAGYEYQDECKEWKDDAHSHSWFSFGEMDTSTFKFKSEDWFRVMKLLAGKYGAENVRLVFFFDN